MTIRFRIVHTSEVGRAHAWHSGFAAANDAIYPRSEKNFYDLTLDRYVWCAITEDDEILGMSYSDVVLARNEVEIGGLMVAAKARGKGIGDILMRLPLAHFLVQERPLRWAPPPTIVSHALRGNEMPRKIITRAGFEYAKEVCIPGHKLPGLRTDHDGNVHGDEFHLKLPEAFKILAEWIETWAGVLRDQTPAEIQLIEDERLSDWAPALRQMAN